MGLDVQLSEFLVTDTAFGCAREVLDELRKGVFAGQPLHQLVPAAGEGARTVVWEPLAAALVGKP